MGSDRVVTWQLAPVNLYETFSRQQSLGCTSERYSAPHTGFGREGRVGRSGGRVGRTGSVGRWGSVGMERSVHGCGGVEGGGGVEDDAGHWHVCVSTVQLVAPMSRRPGIGKLSFRRVFRLCLAPLVLSERRDVDELELDEPDELLDVAVDDMHGQPSAHEP